MIKLSSDLRLPAEAGTQTWLIVGKRGSGKSTTAVRLAEGLYFTGIPFVVIDPVDTWWGLKSSADGRSDGCPVYVFGGQKADLPLEPTAGQLIADTLIETRISAVLSVKHLSGGERARFVGDLAQRLFQKNREPLHVFLEEAHEVAPQQPFKGDEQMLGHVTRIWKLGRSCGLGGSAITQRPASLAKNITTQAEILVVHRTLGPQDVAAVREWIKYHGERDDILAELATLKTGEAYVWAPDFPEGNPIGLRRVQILNRETFDSSATPKAGSKRREPKKLAGVDLKLLEERMAATVERAKADDPKLLRARIAELERAARAPKPAAVERVEVPVLKEAHLKRVEALVERLLEVGQKVGEVRIDLAAALRHGQRPAPAPPRRQAPSAPPAEGLNGPQQRILDALAWLETLGIAQPEEAAVAFLAGYTVGGGAFNNPRGALRTAGLITYHGGRLELTDAGRSAARAPEQPLTTSELHERVLERLPGPEQKLLRVLIDAYPHSVENDELANRSGYEPGGGAFNNPRGRLRTLGLVEYPERGRVAASGLLFLERRP